MNSHIESQDSEIKELREKAFRLERELSNEGHKRSRTLYVNSFLERRFRDFARSGFHRLGAEPEYLELVQLTAQFLREYKPKDNDAVWPTDLCDRVDELSEKLMQKCERT
jgi:hypothetical protein